VLVRSGTGRRHAKAAAVRIVALTGIKLSESQCRRTMKKMGMSLKKCAQILYPKHFQGSAVTRNPLGKLKELAYSFFVELTPCLHLKYSSKK